MDSHLTKEKDKWIYAPNIPELCLGMFETNAIADAYDNDSTAHIHDVFAL